jgi:hypothetical protein
MAQQTAKPGNNAVTGRCEEIRFGLSLAEVLDVVAPVAQGFVDHVEGPMFDAAPPQNIEDGSGHLIPNPE